MNILWIALIILLISNVVVAFIKQQNNALPNNAENIVVLKEQKASLQTSIEIKKCIENITETTNIKIYSQRALECIKAGNKLFNIE